MSTTMIKMPWGMAYEIGAAGNGDIWQPIDVGTDDGAEITFPGNVPYAVIAEIHPGFNAADVLAKLGPSAKYFAGWTVNSNLNGPPKIWTSNDPIPAWADAPALLVPGPILRALGPPPNGNAWLYAEATSPPGGDAELVSRSPFTIFVYRIHDLWMLAAANAPKPTIAQPGMSGWGWAAIGGAGLLGLGAVGYWRKWWPFDKRRK